MEGHGGGIREEAVRRHPEASGDTRSTQAARSHSGITRRHPGGTRRHGGGGQEAFGRHPGDTQEAPKAAGASEREK